MQPLPPVLAEIIRPTITAIIVVDVMDAYFSAEAVLSKLTGGDTSNLDEAAGRIKEFLTESRKYPIASTVFVRMVERPDSMTPNYAYKMRKVDDTPPLVEVDGHGWDYYKVKPKNGDHEIIKRHYNAFTGTDLNEHLESKGVKTLVIVGGFGSRCVAATAIVGADVYGYNVFVPQDLVANQGSNDTDEVTSAGELNAFLQATDAVWGYTPLSAEILQTWKSGR